MPAGWGVAFAILAIGPFLGTLAMLNILGILRFIKLGELETATWGTLTFAVAIGVLPYPVTFLCTDLISELYGQARANAVVWMGLLLNGWVLLILWIGGVLPGFETIDPAVGGPVLDAAGQRIRLVTLAAEADDAELDRVGPVEEQRAAGVALAGVVGRVVRVTRRLAGADHGVVDQLGHAAAAAGSKLSDTTGASVQADAARGAKAIVKELTKLFRTRDWIGTANP